MRNAKRMLALALLCALCGGGMRAARAEKPNAITEARRAAAKAAGSFSAGGGHAVMVREDGTCAAIGDNSFGQCEVGDWRDIVQVSAGNTHTVGLRADGTVVAAGANALSAQDKKAPNPCAVGSWRDVVWVEAHGDSTLGVRKNGKVVAAGRVKRIAPDIPSLRDAVRAYVTDKGVYALKENGKVQIAFDKDFNARGSFWRDPTRWSKLVDMISWGDGLIGLREDGSILTVRDAGILQSDDPLPWPQERIVRLCYGDGKRVALLADGSVSAYTRRIGVFRFPPEWHDVIAIDASEEFVLGLRADGQFLGVRFDALIARLAPTPPPLKALRFLVEKPSGLLYGNHSRPLYGSGCFIGLREDGSLYTNAAADGEGALVHALVASLAGERFSQIMQYRAGSFSCLFALREDGAVRWLRPGGNPATGCCATGVRAMALLPKDGGDPKPIGLRGHGELVDLDARAAEPPPGAARGESAPDGAAGREWIAIAATFDLLAGLREGGTLTGSILRAREGDPFASATPERPISEIVTGWRGVAEITASNRYLAARFENGTAACVGGSEQHPPIDLSTWRDIAQLAADDSTILGLRTDGTVVAAGYFPAQGELARWQGIVRVFLEGGAAMGLDGEGNWHVLEKGDFGAHRVEGWRR